MEGRMNLIKYLASKIKCYLGKLNINLKKKDIFRTCEIQNLFYRIIQNNISIERVYINYQTSGNIICNKNDGIIFTPNKITYISKFPFITFKWKYENGNSVDFSTRKNIQLNLRKKFVFRKQAIFTSIKNKTQFKLKNIKKVNYKTVFDIFHYSHFKKTERPIGEYLLNKKKSDWCFIKNRKDKKYANSIKVVMNTLEISNEGFYKNEIVDTIYKVNTRMKRGKDFIIHF